MKAVMICLLPGCRAEHPAALPMGPAQGGGCGERSEAREVRDPACLMAIPELAGIGDADAASSTAGASTADFCTVNRHTICLFSGKAPMD